MRAVTRFLGPALRGMRANLVPGLVLQAFALLVVISYFRSPALGAFLDGIGAIKEHYGLAASALSTVVFGGVIPYLVLRRTGKIPRHRRVSEFLFYVVFWAWKGVEVDAFYRLQASWFGDAATGSTIALKTAIDQFVYNPLWAAPTQTLLFLWKDCDFSVRRTRENLARESFGRRTLLVLCSTWVVWIPAVAIIYSLPGTLQVPLFNLVLCFWCLLLSFVSRSHAT